jgi:hemoglobin
MQHDIRNESDVAKLIDAFYKKAIADPVIGHFFTMVVHLDWNKHILVINAFWNSILFGTPGYSGNPMDAHIKLDRLSPMEKRHFDKWVVLWTQTVRENFEGPKAEEAINRAGTIATIMAMKLNS